MFGLTEEVFLLSLYEKRKSIVISSNPAFPFALAGAILMELIFYGRIRLEEGKRVVMAEYALSDDKRLDGTLDDILEINRHKRITFWINELSKRGRRHQRSLMKTMVLKKVLEEDKEYHWVLPFPEEHPANGSAKFQLKTKLRNVVLGEESADQKTTALLALLSACNLLDFVFTEDEIKAAGVKIEQIVNREETGAEMIEILQSINSAIDAVMPPTFK
jgi:hypothetical protein